ncbi:hypothetical protein BpHYR1_028612 [Brachionus plicatilis]|uniref:Uncharacterized protein n=1 Tax=Brachionus plicatilis TaxID=10195 RepID=A0A3M7Q941_BRAPC|nr:hypothetical protein BpHYR1_028612 [Brachionus plicatilis]
MNFFAVQDLVNSRQIKRQFVLENCLNEQSEYRKYRTADNLFFHIQKFVQSFNRENNLSHIFAETWLIEIIDF